MTKSTDPGDQETSIDEHHPCADLSPAASRYLLAINDLAQEGKPITQAAVARQVGVSNPTALEMVKRLRSLGMLEPDSLKPTQAGTSAALVLQSRRSATRTLARDVLGLGEVDADAEAERLAPEVSALLGRHLTAWKAEHRDDE